MVRYQSAHTIFDGHVTVMAEALVVNQSSEVCTLADSVKLRAVQVGVDGELAEVEEMVGLQ